MALKHFSLALLLVLASIAIVATANYEPTYQAQYQNVDHISHESTPSTYEPKHEEAGYGLEPKAYPKKPAAESTYKYEENPHQVSYGQVHEIPKKEEKEEKPKKPEQSKPLIDVNVVLPNNEKPEKVGEELKKTSHEVPNKEEELHHESYVPKPSIEKSTKEYTVPVPQYNAKPEVTKFVPYKHEEVHPAEKSPEASKVAYEKSNEKGVEYTAYVPKPSIEKPTREYYVQVPHEYNAKPEEVHPLEKSPETPNKVYYEYNNEKGVEYTSYEQKPNTEKPVKETKQYKYEEAKPTETPEAYAGQAPETPGNGYESEAYAAPKPAVEKPGESTNEKVHEVPKKEEEAQEKPKRPDQPKPLIDVNVNLGSMGGGNDKPEKPKEDTKPTPEVPIKNEHNNIEKPFEYAPGHVEESKQKCSNFAIQGIVYCRSGLELTRLEGAVTRVTCLHLHKDGYEMAPFSVLSKPTDSKGYFYVSVPQNEGISKISDCRVFLNSSPSEICNVPTDVNNGVSGAVPGTYQVLSNKKTELYTVGPFFYTTHPYKFRLTLQLKVLQAVIDSPTRGSVGSDRLSNKRFEPLKPNLSMMPTNHKEEYMWVHSKIVVECTNHNKGRKDGYESAPVSILSKPSNKKGYFYTTLPHSEGVSKISDCQVFLSSSPLSETRNVPTDVDNCISSSAVPGAYQVLPNKKTNLYTVVGPFFYTTPQPIRSGY
ncbi:hypothetical protein Sjap_007392 [Stephania japonica]|uniref:Uncharacterized protein n=1 Tax=Stephania japonica TaxID=461633 RepID=A0AAP0JML5_9MAGN